MSVRWTRTATIANGKYMEAIGWAKEVSGYAQKNFGTTVTVWLDAFGPVGTIRWSADFTDLQALDKVQNQMMTDANYWQLIDKAFKSGLFIDGQAVDHVSRQV